MRYLTVTRRAMSYPAFMQKETHRVIAVEECLIEDKKSQEIIRTIRELLTSFKIKTYNEDTGYGLLRHVLVRRGFETGEIMVVLVLGSPILPSKNNFVKALRKVHPEITTVVLNMNNNRPVWYWEKGKADLRNGIYQRELCGCTFRISPKSFYQVNPVQTEVLYQYSHGLCGTDRKRDSDRCILRNRYNWSDRG